MVWYDDERQKDICISDTDFDENKLFEEFSQLSRDIAVKPYDFTVSRNRVSEFCNLYRKTTDMLDGKSFTVKAKLSADGGIGTVTITGKGLYFDDSDQLLEIMRSAEECEIEVDADDCIEMHLTMWGLHEFL